MLKIVQFCENAAKFVCYSMHFKKDTKYTEETVDKLEAAYKKRQAKRVNIGIPIAVVAAVGLIIWRHK